MKKNKKLIIALLCFSMILPLFAVFEICGAETAIADEDFEGIGIWDLESPNWTLTDPNDTYAHRDIVTVDEATRADGTTVSATNALRIWQEGQTSNMIMNYRNFQPTEKVTISFDYLATRISEGGYFPIFSNGTRKFYLCTEKSSVADVAFGFYNGRSFQSVIDMSYNTWYNIKIEFDNNTAKLYVDGEYKADVTDLASSLTTVDSIVFGTLSTGWKTEIYYIDNLKFKGAHNIAVDEEPVIRETFENMITADLESPNWTLTDPSDAYAHRDIVLAPEAVKADGTAVPATNALRIWQEGQTSNMVMNYRNFVPTDKVSISFDYLATKISEGGYFPIFSDETRKFYLCTEKSSVADVAFGFYNGRSFQSVIDMSYNTWYNIEINFKDGVARLYIDGEYKADVTDLATSLTTVDSIVFGTLSTGWKTETYYIDNLTLTGANNIAVDELPVIKENFENTVTADLESPNWTLTDPSDAYAHRDIVLAPEAVKADGTIVSASNALRIWQEGQTSNMVMNYRNFVPTDKVSISFDYLATKISEGGYFPIFSDETRKFYLCTEKSSVADVAFGFYNGRSFQSVIDMSYNTWYNIEINFKDGVARLYIDGEYKADVTDLATSLTTVDSIVFGTLSTGWKTETYYIDNLTLTGANNIAVNEEISIDEDFENVDVSDLTIPNWTGLESSSSAGGADVALAPEAVKSDGSAVSASNSLRVYQTAATSAMIMNYRNFQPTEKMSVTFDYMPTAIGEGHYFPIFSEGTRKFYLCTEKSSEADVAFGYYNGRSFAPVADMSFNTWYNIKIVFKNNAARLYVDGEYVADITDLASSCTTVDSIVFGTLSTRWVSEEYYIDNLKFTGAYNIEVRDMTTEFTDNFNSENTTDYSYSGTGSYEVIDGKLLLDGEITVTRRLPDKSLAGQFGFTLRADDPTDITFDLMYGNVTAVILKVGENGALYYKRDVSTWNMCTNAGLIEANKTYVIAIDAPDGRLTNYFNVYVNGELVGTAVYHTQFNYIDGMRISLPVDASATVDDVFAAVSNGIIETPDRGEEKDPTVYLSRIIEGTRAMYAIYDTKPESSVLSYVDEKTGVVPLDYCRNSIGVDLGAVKHANGIRIMGDSDTVMKLNIADTALWYSNDNENWDKAYGHILNVYEENGVWSILVEFSGIEARYFKINYLMEDGPSTIAPSDLNASLRVEEKIARQWGLAGTSMYVKADSDPTSTPMVVELNSKTTDGNNNEFVYNVGDSIGINFGIRSNVEAIEIVANGLYTLGKNAFKLYYSVDNCDYYPIDDVILSRDERNGQDVYRLTFDNIKCGYLKLYNVSGGSITLDNLYDSLKAYSSIEVASGHYKKDTVGDDGGIYVRSDGTIVMSFVGFVASSGDHDDAYSLCIQSVDGGYTWSDSWIDLQRRKENMNITTMSYIKLEDGSYGVIYSEKTNDRNDMGSIVAYTYLRRTYDGGKTWSEPIPITEGLFRAYAIQASGYRFTRLSTGRILVPINYNPYLNDVPNSDRITGFVMYSDDDGYTWRMSNNAVTLPNAADEPIITETADGFLIMTLRTRVEGKIYQCVSTDNGLTWSQPHVVEGLVSPSSTNSVDTIPQTGDVILLWNNEFAADNGKRNPLTMAVSVDNGISYKNIRNIRQGHGTYPFADFYGRSVLVQSSAGLTVFDIADIYHTIMGNKTVEDLPKATTPKAKYSNGWLTGVSLDMKFSLDGGETWTFCGGTSVELGDVEGDILVMDIGTNETAPSDIQTIK